MTVLVEVNRRKCSRCHELKPRDHEHFCANKRMNDGLSSWCRECFRQKSLEYGKGHREESRLRARAWRQAHPVEERLRVAAWVATHSAQKAAGDARWRQANQERSRATHKQWAQANGERYRLIRRTAEARRRALKRQASGTATLRQVMDRIAYYGGLCWMCRDLWEHLDHVIPLSRGGTNWPANLRPACATCNRRKGARKAVL